MQSRKVYALFYCFIAPQISNFDSPLDDHEEKELSRTQICRSHLEIHDSPPVHGVLELSLTMHRSNKNLAYIKLYPFLWYVSAVHLENGVEDCSAGWWWHYLRANHLKVESKVSFWINVIALP